MRLLTILLLSLLFTVSCKQQEETKVKEAPPEATIKACTKEAKQCPNGRTVGRNPNINCEFNSCGKTEKPKELSKTCPADMIECPDGQFVGRDHFNNCEFKKCPPSNNGRDSNHEDSKQINPIMCPADVKECSDGSFVSRDHKNLCKFRKCPDTKANIK